MSPVPLPLQSGDVLLLCSDGLWGPLNDAEIAAELLDTPLPETLEQLISKAIGREGPRADNSTAVVARWGDAENEHSAPAPVSEVLDCN